MDFKIIRGSNRLRVGYSFWDKLFNRFHEIKELHHQIDYLDSVQHFHYIKHTIIIKDNLKQTLDNLNKFQVLVDYDSTFLFFSFDEKSFLNDKGETELIKELTKRRDLRYEHLKDCYDVSYLPSRIRELRFKKLLDKPKKTLKN